MPADPAAVARAARERCGLAPGARVLVAVSGGADSVALASLLAEAAHHGLSLDLVLAHLDHGWRGPAEALADRAVVESLAQRLGLALVRAGPPEPPAAGEAAARRWRYATLAAEARRLGATAVATGHHLRDQAETVLMRLLAGSATYGLAGMAPRRALDGGALCVVRPLLDVHPAALRAWNESRGLRWREDPTNGAPGARNDVRRRLIALEARHKDPVATLSLVAERARRRVERRERRLGETLGPLLVEVLPAAAVCAPRAAFTSVEGQDLATALRLLGRPLAADAAGPWFTRRHLATVARALAAGGAVDLPHALTLRVTPARVWLLRRRAPGPRAFRLHVEVVPREGFDLAAFLARRERFTAALDADRLGPTPRLRAASPEDRFTPLGRRAEGPVELEAWMRRRGIPRLARRGALVVEGQAGVAWVPGLREDAAHAVGPATRRVALLRVEA